MSWLRRLRRRLIDYTWMRCTKSPLPSAPRTSKSSQAFISRRASGLPTSVAKWQPSAPPSPMAPEILRRLSPSGAMAKAPIGCSVPVAAAANSSGFQPRHLGHRRVARPSLQSESLRPAAAEEPINTLAEKPAQASNPPRSRCCCSQTWEKANNTQIRQKG
jgi:hypothetical protein